MKKAELQEKLEIIIDALIDIADDLNRMKESEECKGCQEDDPILNKDLDSVLTGMDEFRKCYICKHSLNCSELKPCNECDEEYNKFERNE